MKKQTLMVAAATVLAAGTLLGQRFHDEQAFSRMKAAIGRATIEPFDARFGLSGPVVKNQPYAAEASTETTQTLADGTRIHRKSGYTIYRDTEGRLRRETPASDRVWISDPVANVSYILHLTDHTATRMPLGRPVMGGPHGSFSHSGGPPHGGTSWEIHQHGQPGSVRHLDMLGSGGLNPEKSQQKTENLPAQMIEGVTAQGTRTTVTIPAGAVGNDRPLQIVTERWYSPELQVVVMTRHSDPREGETVYRLANIRRGPPDPALFQVPAGYQTTQPKQ